MLGKFQDDNNINDYDLFVGFLQIYDLFLNINQTSNDTIFHELQRQNKEYLEKIIQQNQEIIDLLKNNKVD